MQSDSRDAILDGIRKQIQQSKHANDVQTADVERAYQSAGKLNHEERLALFTTRLHEYDASVTPIGKSELKDAIAAITTRDTSQPWVVADGFPAEWLPADGLFRWEAQASIDDLNSCAGVVTVCTVGIAITGSIVLRHGPGEGRRRTSLLPDRHLCVIEASQVVESVSEAFERLAAFATHPLTFISGPSATADIEMTRIRGVHGPRRLDVILVQA